MKERMLGITPHITDVQNNEDNMLFSHVKISSFRAKAHLVFHWCLYNKYIFFSFFKKLNFDTERVLKSI